ncbi:unnamed protein product, partial [Onchocerca ochengi]
TNFIAHQFFNLMTSREKLVEKVFPNIQINYKNRDWLNERAILAAKIKDVDELNNIIQSNIQNEAIIYNTVNTVAEANEAGQSVELCGLDIETDCFSHEQLNVAYSRIGKPDNPYIYIDNETTKITVHLRALLQIRNPLLRFFGELHVFTERAILDCASTVDAAEKARTEYRGSLLWMKKTSKELDPDAENILEKFRTAQNVVRRNKEKLDNLKLDTLQKVDLLVASRYNLFSQLLESYQKLLYGYYEQTTLAYEKIYDFVSSRKHYEFEVLTDLIEPLKELDSGNDDQITTVEKGSESLIELDECEQEMEQVLRDLENLNGHDLLDNRIESPLGLLEESQNGDNGEPSDMPKQTLVSVEADPIKEVSNTTVPAIAPPPGWKSNRKAVRRPSDLMDLLSLDDTNSDLNSFASDWSKLTANLTTSDAVIFPSSVTPSSSSLTLPSQLLQFSSTESSFPNPFAESTDPNFDVWKGFLKEFETATVSNSGVFKNC